MEEKNMLKTQWIWISAAIAAFLYLTVRSLSAICFPFFMGFMGAYVFNGVVIRLRKYHLSRGMASALVVLLVLASLVILMMVFVPFVQHQLVSLALIAPSLIESWVADIKPLIETYSHKAGLGSPSEIKSHVSEHIGAIFSWSLGVLKDLLSNGMVLANLLSLVFLTPIIMFYLLKDFPSLIQAIDDVIPQKSRPAIIAFVHRVDEVLSDYAKGQAKVCLVLMVLYSIALTAIGIQQSIFLGIMIGGISFIPYVGALLGLLATLATGFAHFEGWNQIILIFVVFTVISVFEGNFLSPRLIGERVGLHPVWIIFALLAAGTWFGFLGILFALPVAAIVGVSVRVLIEQYKKTSLYSEEVAVQIEENPA